jgi:hypothetical protein
MGRRTQPRPEAKLCRPQASQGTFHALTRARITSFPFSFVTVQLCNPYFIIADYWSTIVDCVLMAFFYPYAGHLGSARRQDVRRRCQGQPHR